MAFRLASSPSSQLNSTLRAPSSALIVKPDFRCRSVTSKPRRAGRAGNLNADGSRVIVRDRFKRKTAEYVDAYAVLNSGDAARPHGRSAWA